MKRYVWKNVRILFVWIIALIFLMPFLMDLMLSFKTNSEILLDAGAFPHSPDFTNYRNALRTLPLATMCKNTFINITAITGITLLVVYPASFALARIPFRSPKMADRIYTFLILGLMIPMYILIFPIYRVNMVLGTIGTRIGLILPLTATNFSFDTLLFVGALKKMPKEIEEAAIIDGCSLVNLMTRISLPMILPTLSTVVVFNVLAVWNEFLFSSLFITDSSQMTLALGVTLFQGQYSMDYAGMIAATILIMIPQIVFYAIFQKWIVKGLTAGAVKG